LIDLTALSRTLAHESNSRKHLVFTDCDAISRFG